MTVPMSHDVLAMTEYGDQPAVLILTDSEAGAARSRLAAEQAGCRVAGTAEMERALARLEEQVAMAAVIVDIERDHGDPLDRLLDRLDVAARQGRHGSVVSAPAELIDLIAARAPHPRVHHLCEADEDERAAAIGLASAPAASRLHDVRRRQAPVRLQQLSEEVSRIANVLARLSEDERVPAVPPPAPGEQGVSLEAAEVRAVIRARRLRDQYFAAALFADPAWDMLLDLFASRLDGERVAVSSLCIAAAVPATTALRWIKTLTDHGLFERVADPQDGRRVFIQLSDRAAAALFAYFVAARKVSPLLG